MIDKCLSRLVTLLYSIVCLYTVDCQQIPFKPLPQISTPFITEEYYSVVYTLIYPKAQQQNKSNKHITQDKNAVSNQKSLATTYSNKLFQITTIPINTATTKITAIQDYYAVVNIYPSLKDLFAQKEKQQKLALLESKPPIIPITKSTTAFHSQNDVSSQQKSLSKKDILPKIEYKQKESSIATYIIIILIAFIIGAVVKLNWRKDNKRVGNFRRLQRFGQSYDQRDQDQETARMDSHFSSQIIISDQFNNY